MHKEGIQGDDQGGASHTSTARQQGPISTSPSSSQPSTHNAPSVYEPEQQQPMTAKPSEAEKEPSELPDWDTVPYLEEEEELDKEPAIQVEPPVHTGSSSTLYRSLCCSRVTSTT